MSPTNYLHPIARGSPRTAPMSIIECGIGDVARCSAVFIFPAAQNPAAYKEESFKLSLQHTLSTYPHLCGSLRSVKYDHAKAQTDHTQRFGRVWLEWGTSSDPGVGFQYESSPRQAGDILPEEIVPNVQDVAKLAKSGLLPERSTVTALRGKLASEIIQRAGFFVKITQLACGSVAVGVMLHHTLADAQTMGRIMLDWSAVHRGLLDGQDPAAILPERPYDPSVLDRYAAGNIDEAEEDQQITYLAESLPATRFDSYASDGPPKDVLDVLDEANQRHAKPGDHGPPIPWDQCDFSIPVKDYIFLFSPSDVQSIWVDVVRASERGTSVISRLDAFMAHLWRAIVQARDLPASDQVYCNISLGLRARMSPPLPPTFLGSPQINCNSTVKVHDLVNGPLSIVAQSIRNTVVAYNSVTIPYVLHRAAYAFDPEREMTTFFGTRHMMTSSWLGIGAYDVDFGGGCPRFVHPGLPSIDGFVVITDAPKLPCIQPDARWHRNGMIVRLSLHERVMEKIVPLLALR